MVLSGLSFYVSENSSAMWGLLVIWELVFLSSYVS